MDVAFVERGQRCPVLVLACFQPHLDAADEVQAPLLLQFMKDTRGVRRGSIALGEFASNLADFRIEVVSWAELIDEVFNYVARKFLQVRETGLPLLDRQSAEGRRDLFC